MELADRLIVGADYMAKDFLATINETGRPLAIPGELAYEAVLKLGEALAETKVIIKGNSVFRECGGDLISDLQTCGLHVMADFKLYDIPNTLKADGQFLYETRPALLTVMAQAGRDAIRQLRDELHPDTELLAVTVLTSFDDVSWGRMCKGQTVAEAVVVLAEEAEAGGAEGLVCSGADLKYLFAHKPREQWKFKSYNTPAIRPLWHVAKKKDDQSKKRIVTPTVAFQEGATRIVVARPILEADDQLAAVKLTLKEIEQALIA